MAELSLKNVNTIERHFHDFLLRVEKEMPQFGPIVLPHLARLYSLKPARSFLPVSGMLGGLEFGFVDHEGEEKLRITGSSRMDDGFGPEWFITADGCSGSSLFSETAAPSID